MSNGIVRDGLCDVTWCLRREDASRDARQPIRQEELEQGLERRTDFLDLLDIFYNTVNTSLHVYQTRRWLVVSILLFVGGVAACGGVAARRYMRESRHGEGQGNICYIRMVCNAKNEWFKMSETMQFRRSRAERIAR
jgi:hypothetical protein